MPSTRKASKKTSSKTSRKSSNLRKRKKTKAKTRTKKRKLSKVKSKDAKRKKIVNSKTKRKKLLTPAKKKEEKEREGIKSVSEVVIPLGHTKVNVLSKTDISNSRKGRALKDKYSQIVRSGSENEHAGNILKSQLSSTSKLKASVKPECASTVNSSRIRPTGSENERVCKVLKLQPSSTPKLKAAITDECAQVLSSTKTAKSHPIVLRPNKALNVEKSISFVKPKDRAEVEKSKSTNTSLRRDSIKVLRLVSRVVHSLKIPTIVALCDRHKFTIGRQNDANLKCDIVLDSVRLGTGALQISRYHAIIRSKENSHWIMDRGSTNGTFINNKRQMGTWTKLKDGDVICFGANHPKSEFVYMYGTMPRAECPKDAFEYSRTLFPNITPGGGLNRTFQYSPKTTSQTNDKIVLQKMAEKLRAVKKTAEMERLEKEKLQELTKKLKLAEERFADEKLKIQKELEAENEQLVRQRLIEKEKLERLAEEKLKIQKELEAENEQLLKQQVEEKEKQERLAEEKLKIQKELEAENEQLVKQRLIEKEKLERLARENSELKERECTAEEEEAKKMAELKTKWLNEFKIKVEDENNKKHAAERLQKEKQHAELECQICTDWCINAHSIRCGHTFCKKCLYDWIGSFANEKEKKPTCPSCRDKIPDGCTPNPNLILDKLISEHFIKEADEDTKEAWNERVTEHKKWASNFVEPTKKKLKKPPRAPRLRFGHPSLAQALNLPFGRFYQRRLDESKEDRSMNSDALDLRRQCKGWTGSRRCPITAQHGFDGTTSNQRRWALPLVHGEDYCSLHKPG